MARTSSACTAGRSSCIRARRQLRQLCPRAVGSVEGIEKTLRTTAWLDAREGALESLAETAAAPSAEGWARVSTPRLEELRKDIAERLAAAEPDDRRMKRAAWSFSRYTRRAFWEASLEETQELLQALSSGMKGPVTRSLSKAEARQAQLLYVFDETLGSVAFDPVDQRTLPSLFSLPGRREFLSGVESPLWTLTSNMRRRNPRATWTRFSPASIQPPHPTNRTNTSLVWTGREKRQFYGYGRHGPRHAGARHDTRCATTASISP